MSTATRGLRAPAASVLRQLLRRREVHLVVLLLVLGLYAGTSTPYFFTSDNIFNLNEGLVEKALIAFPLALVIIVGEIDISVESMVGLAGAVFGQLIAAHVPLGVALVLTVGVGAAGGALNGFLVTRVGLPSLVVTLGTYALYRGLAYVTLGPIAVSEFPGGFITFTQGFIPGTPVPLTFVPLILLILLTGLMLGLTRFGRQLYFIGRNSEAARLGGVRVARLKMTLFVLAGAVSAFAGIILDGRLSSARADNGQGFVLDILTAVILGGVAIAGGEGTVLGVALALAAIGVLENALTLANIDPNVQTTAVGALLVISVAAPSAERMLQVRMQRRRATRPPALPAPAPLERAGTH